MTYSYRANMILDYLRGCSIPPTVREITTAVGLRSNSATWHHLDALRQAGIIEWTPGQNRSIRIIGDEWVNIGHLDSETREIIRELVA